jgi:hypothetical protein
MRLVQVRGGMFNDEDDKLNAGTDWVGLDPDRVSVASSYTLQGLIIQTVILRRWISVCFPSLGM